MRKRTDSPLFRIAVWLLVASTLQVLLLPLVRTAEARGSAGYADWLSDRGAVHSDADLEDALEKAARARHRSLEAFVGDFVRILDNSGHLDKALNAFLVGEGTADELLALILRDLRSLSPKESKATTRLTSSDPGTFLAGHTLAGETSRTVTDDRFDTQSPAQTKDFWGSAFGLMTSIQSLGP